MLTIAIPQVSEKQMKDPLAQHAPTIFCFGLSRLDMAHFG
jgi:hypothetical protein